MRFASSGPLTALLDAASSLVKRQGSLLIVSTVSAPVAAAAGAPAPPSLRSHTRFLILSFASRPPLAYPTHVPLNGLEKGALALLSLWGAFRDPRRGDLVAASGETTGLPALHAMRNRMLASETGRRILLERPLVTVGGGVRVDVAQGGGAWRSHEGQAAATSWEGDYLADVLQDCRLWLRSGRTCCSSSCSVPPAA